MLDIIMPHYTEPWETGRKFFDMLELQRGCDFSAVRVILVNDGEENALPESCFANRPYEVMQISIPHGGVSAARNAGLDTATAEWVMFCDFDDMFANAYALGDILNVLPAPGMDMVWTEVIEENVNLQGKIVRRVNRELNFSMLHGILYRRKVIEKNGIRFDAALTFDEDFDFGARMVLSLDQRRTGKIGMENPPYIYCYNGQSVTAQTGRYEEKAVCRWKRQKKLCELYREKMGPEEYANIVTGAIYNSYYTLNVEDPGPVLTGIMREFAGWYREHKDELAKASDRTKYIEKRKGETWRKKLNLRNEVPGLEADDVPAFRSEKKMEQWLKEMEAMNC